jgi:hypothetical protein
MEIATSFTLRGVVVVIVAEQRDNDTPASVLVIYSSANVHEQINREAV